MARARSIQDGIFAWLVDGGGNHDFGLSDGSITPEEFTWTAPATCSILRLTVSILDGAVAPSRFGGMTALTAGESLRLTIYDDLGAEVFDFLPPPQEGIRANCDWASLAGPDSPVEAGAGDDQVPVRWTFTKALGEPMLLPKGHSFRAINRADLTDLTKMHIMLQGHYG